MKTARNQKSGFTLVEVLISLLVFTIFSVALVATLTLVMRWWFKIKDPEMAEQNARLAAHTVADDFRQAIPNPADPATVNTAIKAPSSLGSGSTLSFYEPITQGSVGFSLSGHPFDPSGILSSGGVFNPLDPLIYQLVTYTVGANSSNNVALMRAVSVNGSFVGGNATGDPVVSTTTPSTSAQAAQALVFNVTVKSTKQITVTVQCAEPSEITAGGLAHTCTLIATTFCQN